jgi:hypothetical protein
MPTIRNHDDTQDVYLATVDQHGNAEDAARELWASVHNATKFYGGRALIREPELGDIGYTVMWESGPPQWAHAYVVSEGADAPGFVAEAADAFTVRFTDLD